MSATVLWTALGAALLIAAAVVIVRLEGASLGPYSTRLLAIAIGLAAYYGALSWAHYASWVFHPVRLPFMQYAVPVSAIVAALYCSWRIWQNWRTELHGLLRGAFKLVLVLALATLARLCLSR